MTDTDRQKYLDKLLADTKFLNTWLEMPESMQDMIIERVKFLCEEAESEGRQKEREFIKAHGLKVNNDDQLNHPSCRTCKQNGKQEVFDYLNDKMGSLDISGGAYGQFTGEHEGDTEDSRTISLTDFAKAKKKFGVK